MIADKTSIRNQFRFGAVYFIGSKSKYCMVENVTITSSLDTISGRGMLLLVAKDLGNSIPTSPDLN